MAKIDISKIEGYETMTVEEKLAALEAYEPDMSGFVKKELLEKANSEAAGYKKQLRERMTEEEAAKAKAAEDMASVMAELEKYRAKDAINEYTVQFLGIGYDEKLAKSTAEALHKGDMATMFKNHAVFVAEHEKAMKAELLKSTPTPPAGDGDKGITKEMFQKMTLAEKQKFFAENPDKYKELYGGN
jgi:hypothetical protein